MNRPEGGTGSSSLRTSARSVSPPSTGAYRREARRLPPSSPSSPGALRAGSATGSPAPASAAQRALCCREGMRGGSGRAASRSARAPRRPTRPAGSTADACAEPAGAVPEPWWGRRAEGGRRGQAWGPQDGPQPAACPPPLAGPACARPRRRLGQPVAAAAVPAEARGLSPAAWRCREERSAPRNVTGSSGRIGSARLRRARQAPVPQSRRRRLPLSWPVPVAWRFCRW